MAVKFCIAAREQPLKNCLGALDIFRSATAFNVSTDYLYGLTDTRTRKDAEKRETAMAPA